MKTVIGAFDNFAEAQTAVDALERAGFLHNDISVVTNNERGTYGATDTQRDDRRTGNVAGETATGAVAGGLTGLLIGLAPFVIPGLGAIAAAGWLTLTLTGAAVGATVGLVGALMGVGVPEEEAHVYQENVRRGGTLVLVRAEDNRADDAARILSDAGAVDIDERAARYRNEGFTPAMAGATAGTAATANYRTQASPTTTDTYRDTATTVPANTMNTATSARSGEAEMAIPVVEEEVQIGKREVQRGGVRVYTHVTEQPVNESINLREEHVHVDRRPVNRAVADADSAMIREGVIEVTERAEVPVVHKEARVVEEVVIRKDVDQRTETISDTVRRTDVDVEEVAGTTRTAGTTVAGTTATGTTTDTRGVGKKSPMP